MIDLIEIQLESGFYSQRTITAKPEHIKPLPDGSLVFRQAEVRDFNNETLKGFTAGAVCASEIKATNIIHD